MKKIFLLLVFIVVQLFLSIHFSFAGAGAVEDAFLDIDSDYKYYKELQVLYERGMIFPDENRKFNAKKLLNRDEFVGISMEVTCKRCISPNTNFSFIKEYSQVETFYDVRKSNKYFYCIAESDKKGYVKGYDHGYQCENNIVEEEKRPFCVDNKITLEEALAVILRNSGLFTIEDNKKVIQEIYDGKITEKLADDLAPKNSNGTPYTFYGYFRKALDFELVEYNQTGEEKVYKLLETEGNKVRPGQNISKEDFLRIAYIALKANSCVVDIQNDLAISIEKLPKECTNSGEECSQKDFSPDEDTFDFSANVFGICEKGVDEETGYNWKFYNISTGEEIIKSGKYIDNYRFLSSGKWRVFLNVIDKCGNAGNIYSTVMIQGEKIEDEEEKDTSLGVLMKVDPLSAPIGTTRNFTGLVEGGNGDYSYEWDYGDGTTGSGKKNTHIYNLPGIYIVKLTVTDGDGKTGTSIVTVVVEEKPENSIQNFVGADIRADPIYGKEGMVTNFEGVGKGGTGNYKYLWDYGDGEKATGKINSHTYNVAGIYNVKLTIIDSKGKRGTSNVNIVVRTASDIETHSGSGLGADILASPIYGETSIIRNFTGLAEGGGGNYIYKWDYGDGQSGTGEINTHEYTAPGVYTVKLTVTDEEGKTGNSTVTIVVTQESIKPLALQIGASPMLSQPGKEIDFSSIVSGGKGNYLYEWSFGDTNIEAEANPQHIYELVGAYIATLEVSDESGKTAKASLSVKIGQRDNLGGGMNVEISANPQLGNLKLNVQFESLISGDGEKYSYAWDFGDGGVSYLENPQYSFNVEGNYTVNLIVTDAAGNTGEASITITVLDGDSCQLDDDGDGIMDCDDKCFLIPGDSKNEGCPILEQSCSDDCSCQDGYICTNSDIAQCASVGVCVPQREVLNPCLEKGQSSLIYGNASCNSCPCSNALDFNSTIRECDLIFPAITSPDSSEIYSRGAIYKVK